MGADVGAQEEQGGAPGAASGRRLCHVRGWEGWSQEIDWTYPCAIAEIPFYLKHFSVLPCRLPRSFPDELVAFSAVNKGRLSSMEFITLERPSEVGRAFKELGVEYDAISRILESSGVDATRMLAKIEGERAQEDASTEVLVIGEKPQPERGPRKSRTAADTRPSKAAERRAVALQPELSVEAHVSGCVHANADGGFGRPRTVFVFLSGAGI